MVYTRSTSHKTMMCELNYYFHSNCGMVCGSVAELNMNRKSQLHEDNKFRILRLLEKNPDITQREIAGHLGLSASGINYCLKSLIEKGLVKIQNFRHSKNKFGYAYVLTPSGIIEKTKLAAAFLNRKMQEYHDLRLEIDMLQSEVSKTDRKITSVQPEPRPNIGL